jgi:hypothetical protein
MVDVTLVEGIGEIPLPLGLIVIQHVASRLDPDLLLLPQWSL